MPMQFWHSEPQYKIKILHYLITNLTKITRSRSIFNHVTHADLCQVLDHLFHCGLQVRLFLTGQQTQLRFAERLTVKQENKRMLSDTDHTEFLMMFDRLMLHSHYQQNMLRANIVIQNVFLFPFTWVVNLVLNSSIKAIATNLSYHTLTKRWSSELLLHLFLWFNQDKAFRNLLSLHCQS